MKIDSSKLTIIQDTREKKPLNLAPMNILVKSLVTGDYSIKGLEDIVCVERKEFSDLVGCLGVSRDRFTRELDRMRSYQFKCIVVEGRYDHLARGKYRSQINPVAAKHTISSWVSQYQVPIMFLENEEHSSDFVKHYLYSTAQRLFNRYSSLLKCL